MLDTKAYATKEEKEIKETIFRAKSSAKKRGHFPIVTQKDEEIKNVLEEIKEKVRNSNLENQENVNGTEIIQNKNVTNDEIQSPIVIPRNRHSIFSHNKNDLKRHDIITSDPNRRDIKTNDHSLFLQKVPNETLGVLMTNISQSPSKITENEKDKSQTNIEDDASSSAMKFQLNVNKNQNCKNEIASPSETSIKASPQFLLGSNEKRQL